MTLSITEQMELLEGICNRDGYNYNQVTELMKTCIFEENLNSGSHWGHCGGHKVQVDAQFRHGDLDVSSKGFGPLKQTIQSFAGQVAFSYPRLQTHLMGI